MYAHRVEKASEYDYSDAPQQAVIDRLRDVVELQAREIMRLQAVIHRLEQSPVGYGYSYEWNANVRADGAYQE